MPKRREATNLAPAATPLGRFIREQRRVRGWSQDELASNADANLTFTSISNIERGKVGLPDPPAMIAIARALGMHVCDLYVEAGYPEFATHGDGLRVAETGPEYEITDAYRLSADEETEREFRAMIAAQERRTAVGATRSRLKQTGKLIDIQFRRVAGE